MTPEWGGEELSSEKQNLDPKTKFINLLTIRYWNEYE
jgi:hypothetical protein